MVKGMVLYEVSGGVFVLFSIFLLWLLYLNCWFGG